MVYPRDKVKSYGTKAQVEGVFASGDRAVVVDDLATTGASKLEAIAKLSAADLVVEDVVVLIDREGGAGDELASGGYQLHAVLTITDLTKRLRRHGLIDDAQVVAVREFVGG